MSEVSGDCPCDVTGCNSVRLPFLFFFVLLTDSLNYVNEASKVCELIPYDLAEHVAVLLSVSTLLWLIFPMRQSRKVQTPSTSLGDHPVSL